MAKKIGHKKPWLAAFLNLIVPGVGYLYLGKRKAFSVLLLISLVVFGLALFSDPGLYKGYGESLLAGVSGFIVGLAFAVDAYLMAKEG